MVFQHLPACSPDLNPIETVWKKMKEYTQAHHGGNLFYDKLRVAGREAWDSISEDMPGGLISEMKARCWAVIQANGKSKG